MLADTSPGGNGGEFGGKVMDELRHVGQASADDASGNFGNPVILSVGARWRTKRYVRP